MTFVSISGPPPLYVDRSIRDLVMLLLFLLATQEKVLTAGRKNCLPPDKKSAYRAVKKVLTTQ
jgi:hypothetical protein